MKGDKEMSKKSSGYVSAINGLPLLIKLLLALPVIDGIIYGIYRILKGHVIAGIIWIFIGATIGWIIDMITIILNGKVTFLA